MSDVAILGVGMTRFAKQAQRGYESLVAEAVRQAFEHADLRASDIQASFCGAATAPPGIGQKVLKNIGVTGRPIVNVENACASGSTAIVEACAWIRAGLCPRGEGTQAGRKPPRVCSESRLDRIFEALKGRTAPVARPLQPAAGRGRLPCGEHGRQSELVSIGPEE